MKAENQERKKFYITTAIDYVNGPPHIGHALEKIQADVLARYHRLQGDEAFFLTGTDEHGAKIARAAEAARKDPQRFTDEMATYFRQLKEPLNLSWNDFVRTSDQKRHWPGAQKLWMRLFDAGDLYKKKYEGLYCVGHEAFVTEKDLVDGKCRDHQKEPELIAEENWFFRLSKYTKAIKEHMANGRLQIIPETRQNEILSFLEQGLEDVSFSRPAKDLSWGIPVPNDPEHTMYVWCDALTNYITALGYGEDEGRKTRDKSESQFARFWPADVHVIGKDILRFHAAIWPGMLLSAGLPLPRAIFVHGFITVEGQKMSKTIGNVIDPFELVKKYGTDPVRYYLLREIPSGEDGDFSESKFRERYNGDLANGLGNFSARIITLAEKLKAKRQNLKATIQNAKLNAEIRKAQTGYETAVKDFKLHEALEQVWQLIHAGDKYINEERPWESEKLEVIGELLGMLLEIARLLEPFLPGTAQKIRDQIVVKDSNVLEIKRAGTLFPRL